VNLCPHCDTLVADKHAVGHMLYKHFLDFYQQKIRTEQADFGLSPGQCPAVGCGKEFKLKKSQADLLMKHYVTQHFSIAEARAVCEPVIQPPPPTLEPEEEKARGSTYICFYFLS
jgi:hypothetical protein